MKPKKKSAMWRRAKVASVLGVHVTRVRTLEAQGKLPCAEIDENGVHLFEPRAVARYAKTRPARKTLDGELAATVFEMFEARYTLPQIVRQTRQSPDTIRKLHAEYLRPLIVPVRDELLEHFEKTSAEVDDMIAKQRTRANGGHQ
jgi:hypothetical protein